MIQAQATPTSPEGASSPAKGASGWRWALVTLALIAFILSATFAAHSIVARQRRPPATPAPALPPLNLLAVTAPDSDYELTALDTALGHIVALAADRQPQCPPVDACPAAPPLAHFEILDGATGQVIASTPLNGVAATASAASFLTVDDAAKRAYAVSTSAVSAFSTETGVFIASYPLPALASGVAWVGAALDAAHARLFVMGSDGTLVVHSLADASAPVATVTAPAGLYRGLVLERHADVLYTLRGGAGGSGATLLAIDAATLATVAQTTLSTAAVLGPVDSTTGAVAVLGADGVTYSATVANGHIALASGGPANAVALGWNPAQGHTYVAHADDVAVLDVSGKAVAVLPVRVYGGTALLADPTRNMLYLSANGGSLIIAQDAAAPTRSDFSPATAIMLARAALANYLPDTNQNPPFLDTETFWPGATALQASGGMSATRAHDFWIHFSDRGWTGPYSGSAETAYTPQSSQPNTYQVTFTITWQQIFQRSHTWTLNVAPDGSVAYVSDGGDAVP